MNKRVTSRTKKGLLSKVEVQIRIIDVLSGAENSDTAVRQDEFLERMKGRRVTESSSRKILNAMVAENLIHRFMRSADSLPSYFLSDNAKDALGSLEELAKAYSDKK